MRIADVTYFAPHVPFSSLDLSGEKLPDQLTARIEGYYLSPAERCIAAGDAFAAGVLLVACIDAVSRLELDSNRRQRSVRRRFVGFARSRLQSFAELERARILYEDFRCGLVHEARIKNAGAFELGLGRAFDHSLGISRIDPSSLLLETRTALHSLVTEIR